MASVFLPLAALAAQQSVMISNTVPPPPMAVTVPVRAPTPIMAVPPQQSPSVHIVPAQPERGRTVLQPLEPVTVWVRIFAGRRLLLSDQLRVARYNATAILQRHEAPGENCPPDSDPTVQSSLTFQINREASMNPEEFFVGLSWSYPVDDCRLTGSRGLSIAQPVVIKPGQPTVITGDGGLRIELSLL
jgi:hypothetical protein